MTLTTLRTQVRDLVTEPSGGRLSDSTLNDLIERATQRIEADYANDYGVIPRQMIDRFSGTITTTGVALPTDFLRARAVKIGDSVLRYMAPENMPEESSNVDATVNVVYAKRLPKLVNDTDTNWLLDIASRVYVYATAIEYSYWDAESAGMRSGWQSEYVDARDQTARSNSPRPSGGWGRQKGFQRGYYSVVGENMIFGLT